MGKNLKVKEQQLKKLEEDKRLLRTQAECLQNELALAQTQSIDQLEPYFSATVALE